MTPELAAAERYLDRGLSVIPLERASKRAAGRWRNLQHRRMDSGAAYSWWSGRTGPVAGLGIVTGAVSGNLTVLDIEPEHVAYVQARVALPHTGLVRTAREGLHIYCRGASRCGKLAIEGRIVGDVRGEGGYVVAPPTATDAGQYSWTTPLTDLAPTPSWGAPHASRQNPPPPRDSQVLDPLIGAGVLYDALPSGLQIALADARPRDSWSELAFATAKACVQLEFGLEEFEAICAATVLQAHLETRRANKADPDYTRRTYINAACAVARQRRGAVVVRLERMVEFVGRFAQRRVEFTFRTADGARMHYGIPMILRDGCWAPEFAMVCRAFGGVPGGRWAHRDARAVIASDSVVELLPL